MAEDTDPKLQALSGLVAAEEQARKAETLRDLAFVMVNDSRRVLSYRQAVLYRLNAVDQPRIERASNVSDLDPNAPGVVWLTRLAEWLHANQPREEPVALKPEDLPEELREEADEFLAPYFLHLPLVAPGGHLIGALLMTADEAWGEAEAVVGRYLAGAYAHAWRALERPTPVRRAGTHLRRYWRRYALAAIIFLLIPVRQYSLAPAEVVPRDPHVITAPMNGVVEKIRIEPNQVVAQDDLLFTMEDTKLSNKYEVARKAWQVARAEYLRNAQESFDCEDCRARTGELKAVMEREKVKMEWAKRQLERSKVKSPEQGVAVFSDASEWEGRPVDVGERVMVVADPESTRLEIMLPATDAIATQAGTEVVFYPNVNPLDSYKAAISQSSYEAEPQPDKSIAFKLMASFDERMPRLGLRGTAKIYGGYAPIAYLVLRKPVSWLRRTLGF